MFNAVRISNQWYFFPFISDGFVPFQTLFISNSRSFPKIYDIYNVCMCVRTDCLLNTNYGYIVNISIFFCLCHMFDSNISGLETTSRLSSVVFLLSLRCVRIRWHIRKTFCNGRWTGQIKCLFRSILNYTLSIIVLHGEYIWIISSFVFTKATFIHGYKHLNGMRFGIYFFYMWIWSIALVLWVTNVIE